MPAFFGEIEVNITILDMLVLRLESKDRKIFIQTLTEEENVDYHQLFPDLVLGM
jgi:hypothetical protein